jgi:hypothetical protein
MGTETPKEIDPLDPTPTPEEMLLVRREELLEKELEKRTSEGARAVDIEATEHELREVQQRLTPLRIRQENKEHREKHNA